MDRRLPDEILRNISSFLPPSDMSRFSRTSTTIRDIYNPNLFNIEGYPEVKNLYERVIGSLNILNTIIDYKGGFHLDPRDIDVIGGIVGVTIFDSIVKVLRDSGMTKRNSDSIINSIRSYYYFGIIRDPDTRSRVAHRTSSKDIIRAEGLVEIPKDLQAKGVVPTFYVVYKAIEQFKDSEDHDEYPDPHPIITQALINFERERNKFLFIVLRAFSNRVPTGTSRQAYRMRYSSRKTKRSTRKSVRKTKTSKRL